MRVSNYPRLHRQCNTFNYLVPGTRQGRPKDTQTCHLKALIMRILNMVLDLQYMPKFVSYIIKRVCMGNVKQGGREGQGGRGQVGADEKLHAWWIIG